MRILITGSSTGIGNLTARVLGAAGHTVWASMRSAATPAGEELSTWATAHDHDVRPISLDVRSEDSIHDAVELITKQGELDVIVHNAGHLAVGYIEAFTPEDISALFDVNVLGAHRVNRAVLPTMRHRGTGTLLWVGSTSIIDVPPFLGPYVASKAAFDVLAQATRYEVAPLGIESVIVMPGPFTRGTSHFANASHASDQARATGYRALDPLVARNLEMTDSLFPDGVEPDPIRVAEEIARILALPFGHRPFRSIVDLTRFSVDDIVAAEQAHIDTSMQYMGVERLLTVAGAA